MNKKIIVSVIVIFSGLMLGVIFSNLFSNNRTLSSQNDQNLSINSNNINPTSTPEAEKEITASIEIEKPTITAFVGDHTKQFEKIDKALVLVRYQNTSTKDFKDLKLWVDADSFTDLKFSQTDSAKHNHDDTSRTGKQVFDVGDIRSGEAKNVYVLAFSDKPGRYTLTAQIKSSDDEDLSNRATPVTLTVR